LDFAALRTAAARVAEASGREFLSLEERDEFCRGIDDAVAVLHENAKGRRVGGISGGGA
jgi:hypothetical protein